MSTPWFELYGAAFGKRLSPDEIEAFDTLFESQVRFMKAGEVSRAVQSLGEDYRKFPKKYPPTANDIVTRIIKLKHSDKLEDPNFNRDHQILVHRWSDEAGREEIHYVTEPAFEWQRDIKRAAEDPDRVGDIICRPALLGDCKEREEYAKRMGIKYRFGGVLK